MCPQVYSQTRAGARTPFQDPNIKLSFTSRLSQRPVTLRPTSNPNLGTGSSPSNGQTDVSDRHNTLTVNVGYMNASIAMYATLQIIRLVQAAGKVGCVHCMGPCTHIVSARIHGLPWPRPTRRDGAYVCAQCVHARIYSVCVCVCVLGAPR